MCETLGISHVSYTMVYIHVTNDLFVRSSTGICSYTCSSLLHVLVYLFVDKLFP